jgi:hypothetical protein
LLWPTLRVYLRMSVVLRLVFFEIFFERANIGRVYALLTEAALVYLTGDKKLSTRSTLAMVAERKVLALSTNLYRLIPLCSCFLGVVGFLRLACSFFALVVMTFLPFLRGLF